MRGTGYLLLKFPYLTSVLSILPHLLNPSISSIYQSLSTQSIVLADNGVVVIFLLSTYSTRKELPTTTYGDSSVSLYQLHMRKTSQQTLLARYGGANPNQFLLLFLLPTYLVLRKLGVLLFSYLTYLSYSIPLNFSSGKLQVLLLHTAVHSEKHSPNQSQPPRSTRLVFFKKKTSRPLFPDRLTTAILEIQSGLEMNRDLVLGFWFDLLIGLVIHVVGQGGKVGRCFGKVRMDCGGKVGRCGGELGGEIVGAFPGFLGGVCVCWSFFKYVLRSSWSLLLAIKAEVRTSVFLRT